MRTKYIFIFTLSLIAIICYYFNYQAIFHTAPQSNHLWRQADGASYTMYYAQDSADFWQPTMLNTFGKRGHTVSEFPILYFIAGRTSALLGFQDGWLRCIHFTCFALGLVALSLLIFQYTQQLIYAICSPLLLLVSPLLTFYAFNFLPDAAALGFCFMGWWLFNKWQQSYSNFYLFLFCGSFMTAGLLKVTLLVTLLSILLVFYFVKILFEQVKFNTLLLSIIAIMGSMGLVVAWYAWARHYNTVGSDYLMTYIMPIWKMKSNNIQDTVQQILVTNKHFYFQEVTFYFWAVLLIVCVIYWRSIELLWRGAFLVSILGIFTTMLLWFQQLSVHEYYAIAWMVIPAFLLLMGGMALSKKMPRFFNSWIFNFSIISLLIANTHNAKLRLAIYYPDTYRDLTVFNPLYFQERSAVRHFLDSIGVSKDALVISTPDISPNASLYLMDRRGLSGYNFFRKPFSHFQVDSLSNYKYEYLIINNPDMCQDTSIIPSYVKPIGNYKNSIYVFRTADF